jgi:5'-nucleotidase
VVAAPSWDSSGASAALTAVQKSGRFLYAECPLGGGPSGDGGPVPVERCLAVEAAPAFIVRAALDGAFGRPPDVVLSGINRGLNTGQTVLHSGTVGAVLTAATRGVSGAAFSVDNAGPIHWQTAARVARAVVHWLRVTDRLITLNVNVPNLAVSQLRGMKRAALAPGGEVQSTMTEVGVGLVAQSEIPDPSDAGTDVALVAAGFACFSPLRPVCENDVVDARGLEATPLG